MKKSQLNFIKMFFEYFKNKFKKKDCEHYAKARAQRLSIFTTLQNDLKTDNEEIQSEIENKLNQLAEINAMVKDFEKTKIENISTINQITKFV